MKAFFKAIALSIAYVIGVTLIFIIKRYNKSIVKMTIGKIRIYGTRKVVDGYELAIRRELPKYDPELTQAIVNGNIEFDIIYQDILSENIKDIPEARTFFPPQWIADYGAEGMCQHVVYCFFVMKGARLGLVAAINQLERKKRVSDCRMRMKTWLIDKNFPQRWISLYDDKENVATNAGEVPTRR